jgi:hypothetical protein
MKPSAWMTFSLALMAPAVSASGLTALIDLPVAASVLIATSQNRGTSPVEVALGVAGTFEGARQLIVQTHASAESPSASRVIVIRDGLLDDAVRTERWDITVVRTTAGPWEAMEVKKSWRCWRAQAAGFAAQPCP